MEFWSGVGSIGELDAWVKNEVATNFDPPPEIYGCKVESYDSADNAAYYFANYINGFIPQSEAGELIAMEILTEYCNKYLNNEITHYEFSKLIRVYDANFSIAEWDQTIKIPAWLGNLYNLVDWRDHEPTRECLQCLREEAEAVYNHNKIWLVQHQT